MTYLMTLFMVGTVVASTMLCLSNQLIHHCFNWRARSQCDHCNTILKWWQLCPVFSSLLLCPYCPTCGKKVAAFYWQSELLGGCLFACTILYAQKSLTYTATLLIISLLFCMSTCDLVALWVPDSLQILLFIPCLYLALHQPYGHVRLILWLIFAAALLSLIHLKPDWLGGADVKLFLLLSMTLSPNYYAPFIGLAAIIGLISWMIRRQWLQPIPFIPCISLAYYIMTFLIAKGTFEY